MTSGTFTTHQIWAELNILTPEGKAYLRVALNRLVESGVIARTGIDGAYRRVDNDKKPLDWQSADPNNFLALKLPFGIDKFCRIYPKSIIIVAGSKNAGKTAFLLQTVAMNMGTFPVDLYNSETGPEQLKMRFEPLKIPNPAPFQVWERYDNYADVVEPNNMSVIDYLDIGSEVYMVGIEIDRIYQKLERGVAIIGLQKPPPSKIMVRGVEKIIDRDLAYGGGFTAKRAVLYISLSAGKCKLVYVKTPANGRIVPDNMTWTYQFSEDGYFTNAQRYYGDNTES